VAVPRRARRRAARFWTYVVAALRAVEPEVGADAHALLDAGQFDPDVVLATLLNDLQALGHDLVLVIDDYHLIESAPIHETMTFLVEHLPANVGLVLVSRSCCCRASGRCSACTTRCPSPPRS